MIDEALAGKPDGAFLVRDDPESETRFILSYRYGSLLIMMSSLFWFTHVSTCRLYITPCGSFRFNGMTHTCRLIGTKTGVGLEGSSRRFPVLHALIDYYS